MQDKKKYEINSTDDSHSDTANDSNKLNNDNSINSILDDIKYIKGSRNSQRTPFSKEDDEILISYLRENDLPTSGKILYQNLEKEYPQHTWQSWRNRWMRILEPRINSKKIKIFKSENTNNDDKLKKIYESVKETNIDKENDNQDVNLSFENRKKRVMSTFNHFNDSNDDVFYNENNNRKKRKIISPYNEISDNSEDSDSEIENIIKEKLNSNNKLLNKTRREESLNKNVNKFNVYNSNSSKEKNGINKDTISKSKEISKHITPDTQSNNEKNKIEDINNTLSNTIYSKSNNINHGSINNKNIKINNTNDIIDKSKINNNKNDGNYSNNINSEDNVDTDDDDDQLEDSSFKLYSQDMKIYDNPLTNKNSSSNNSNDKNFYIPLTEFSYKNNWSPTKFQSSQDKKNDILQNTDKETKQVSDNDGEIEEDFNEFNFESLASQPLISDHEILGKDDDDGDDNDANDIDNKNIGDNNNDNVRDNNNDGDDDVDYDDDEMIKHEHSLSIIPNIIRVNKLKNKSRNIFESKTDEKDKQVNDFSDYNSILYNDLIDNEILLSDDDDNEITKDSQENNNSSKLDPNEMGKKLESQIINKNSNAEPKENNNKLYNNLNKNSISKNKQEQIVNKHINIENNTNNDTNDQQKQNDININEDLMENSIDKLEKDQSISKKSTKEGFNFILPKDINNNTQDELENNNIKDEDSIENIKDKEEKNNDEMNDTEEKDIDSTESFEPNYLNNNSFPFIDNNIFLSQPTNMQDELF